jgi:hypothetical protein
MTLAQRIDSLAALGQVLSGEAGEPLSMACKLAEIENPWFTQENIHLALTAIADQFLDKEALDKLAMHYKIPYYTQPKTIALVLAGNIPLVGFHDILCCFLAGQKSAIKYSDKDKILIPFLLEELTRLAPSSAPYFERVDKISGYDAAIVTGSDNTARHFAYYFRNVPHIIRKNRTSTAILSGTESEAELHSLSEDIFRYFGLGCRNVSHVWVPAAFDLHRLIKAFDAFSDLMHHSKYKNNYDYNLALFLLNGENFLQAEQILLRESMEPASRIACLHYSRYNDLGEVKSWLDRHAEKIQCVSGNLKILGVETVSLGHTQRPTLETFADNIDTLSFLLSL